LQPQELLALLGRYDTDPYVEAALSHYAVRNRPALKIDLRDPDGPVVETQSWVKNSRAGIEFGFDDEASWLGLDETEYGKRPLLLTQIYMYGRHDGVRPYLEPLPFRIDLSDDRETTRKKLGAFESTRHSHLRDTWDTTDFRITVAYTEDDRAIDFVLCMLREPALPPLAYDLQPVPSADTLVEVLGLPISDPEVLRAFGPLGLADRADEIQETGEADFRNPYGVTVGVSPAVESGGNADPGRVVSAVTLYQERELDARGWPGEIPFGIRFDDSPETAVRKVGRQPDHQTDEWFSGYAVWHDLPFSFLIFYNTMENRMARISLFAPGFWAKWHQE